MHCHAKGNSSEPSIAQNLGTLAKSSQVEVYYVGKSLGVNLSPLIVQLALQNRLCFLHVNPFFLFKYLKASGQAYLESGIKDKAFTGEYKTRKVGLFSSKKKRKFIMREEEVFN